MISIKVGIIFILVMTWVYTGFYFPDPYTLRKFSGRFIGLIIWGVRILFPIVVLIILTLYVKVRTKKISYLNLSLLVGSTVVTVFLAFTAAVFGGIGSLPGAMLGGLIIGLIETFWSAYFTIEYKDVAAFSMLAIVLIFFPTGLLGRPEVEKV